MKVFPFSRFVVKDHSMEPSFCEFDRVFTYNWGKVQKGSVVVFKRNGEYLIKRVKEFLRSDSGQVKSDIIVAVSDNRIAAKTEYKVKPTDIIGRVFLKY